MKHLSEDQLALFYYGEGEGQEATEQHLADCAECRIALQELQRDLNMITAPIPPARTEDYGNQVWNRIRAHLHEAEQGTPKRRLHGFFSPQRLLAAFAVAAMVIIAFFAGRNFHSQPATPPLAQNAAQTKEQVRERVLLVALSDHLERSQMVLMELANAPADGKLDISSEQRRAEALLDANRLYRQTAMEAGDPRTAAVLDQLERVLLQVAHGPNDLDAAQLQRLQQRLQEQGILFKIKVLGSSTHLPRRNVAPATHDSRNL